MANNSQCHICEQINYPRFKLHSHGFSHYIYVTNANRPEPKIKKMCNANVRLLFSKYVVRYGFCQFFFRCALPICKCIPTNSTSPTVLAYHFHFCDHYCCCRHFCLNLIIFISYCLRTVPCAVCLSVCICNLCTRCVDKYTQPEFARAHNSISYSNQLCCLCAE